MITGMVNANREAIIHLIALGPQGHQQEIEAVIDAVLSPLQHSLEPDLVCFSA